MADEGRSARLQGRLRRAGRKWPAAGRLIGSAARQAGATAVDSNTQAAKCSELGEAYGEIAGGSCGGLGTEARLVAPSGNGLASERREGVWYRRPGAALGY